MRQCWREFPQERPTFTELVQNLDSILTYTTSGVSGTFYRILELFFVGETNGVFFRRGDFSGKFRTICLDILF